MSKHSNDNRANQLNPNNAAYWTSRGHDGPPASSGGGGPAEKPATVPTTTPAEAPKK